MEATTRWQRARARPKTRRGLRRRLLVWGITLVGVLILLVAAFGVIGAVAGTHTLGSVTYAQVPPNSGDHSPVWQHCGFYAESIGDEHAIHSLEHGAVWITYAPDLAGAEIAVLRALAETEDEVIVSPYPDLPAPVVVSAWNRQVPFDAADGPRLAQTVRAMRNGPDAPEPDATCDGPNLWLTGGTGKPDA